MVAKYGLLLAVFLVGGFALPLEEDDVSIFFDHSQEDFDGRIVGGVNAGEGSWPWIVGLSTGVWTRSYLCGGSLISQRHILTAAHCVHHVFNRGSLDSSLRAHVGTNRWNSGGQTLTLQRNITHPNYVQPTIRNDLSVLITTANVQLNNQVRTIPINFDWVGAGVPVRVAGWGRIRQGGAFSNTLLELRMNTFDGSRCVTEVARVAAALNIRNVPTVEPHIELCTFHSTNYGTCHQGGAFSNTLLELRMNTFDGSRCVTEVARVAAALNIRNVPTVEPHIELCTFHSTNYGTCHGDSGGPLVRNSNNQQVGLVSWGLPCARGAPDMFVRLSAFRAWIEAALRS